MQFIKSTFWFHQKKIYVFLALLILFSAFLVRVYNLNYNTPFSDEAIYIVLGKMGIFQWDWWTYNASSWFPGLIYLYPVLSALTYQIGGIVGSRFLSVIFGVLAIESIFSLTYLVSGSHKSNDSRVIAGLIAAALLGGAGVSIYVSRLATYDIPSFYFFLTSLVILEWSFTKSEYTGKWYFIASILLLLGFFMKIVIGFYIPLIFLYGFVRSSQKGNRYIRFYMWYFVMPIIFAGGIYALTNISGLQTYVFTQAGRSKTDFYNLLNILWINSNFIWLFFVAGAFGMLVKKEFKNLFLLSIAASWIIIGHFVSQRLPALDKHIYLGVIFLCVISGIGISNLLNELSKFKLVRDVFLVFIILSIVLFWKYSYSAADRYNSMWLNTTALATNIPYYIHSGDKVLSEAGPPLILDSYNINFPTNTTTFDWFYYKDQEGGPAYMSAIRDGYFDVVELEGDNQPKDVIRYQLHFAIKSHLSANYDLVYRDSNFEIYELKNSFKKI